MADFHTQEYWSARFESETQFEWLVTAQDFFEQVLQKYIQPDSKVLHLGFGTSDLQNYLRQAGCKHIVNVDFEPAAVARGRELERRRFGDVRMSYLVADVTNFPPEFACDGDGFDLVVDKSTADAVACGGDDALLSMARSVRRCLSAGGLWLCCSYSATRFHDIPDLPFDVQLVHRFPLPQNRPTDPELFHSCYLLTPR